MIDADELIETMNQLAVPIIEREAKEMIDFADQDKGFVRRFSMKKNRKIFHFSDSFLSFEEFLTVLADALVLVDDRAIRIFQLDKERDEEHHG